MEFSVTLSINFHRHANHNQLSEPSKQLHSFVSTLFCRLSLLTTLFRISLSMSNKKIQEEKQKEKSITEALEEVIPQKTKSSKDTLELPLLLILGLVGIIGIISLNNK